DVGINGIFAPLTIKSDYKEYTVSIDHYNRLFRGIAKWFRDNPSLNLGTRLYFGLSMVKGAANQIIVPHSYAQNQKALALFREEVVE
ncbi:MAG: hypothetical protein ACTSUS_02555, partial [Candidatus Freyarchaeota archaeon]